MARKPANHKPENDGKPRKLKVVRATLRDLDARKDVKGGAQQPYSLRAGGCMTPNC